MNIFLANPRGFCAGVKRAINIVNAALKIWGKPIYVNHEIVHNTYVTSCLKSQGVIFSPDIDLIPVGSILIISAHGVSKNFKHRAIKRRLKIIDATCPLVKKVHKEVSQASDLGFEVILIGTSEHPEIKGTMGQYNNANGNIYLIESIKDVSQLKVKQPNNLTFMTQTTLSLEVINPIISELRRKYPNITNPKNPDICYATINRQIAVKELSKISDAIIIIGSKHSSNSNQLFKLAKKTKKNSILIDSKNDININHWDNNIKSIGIAAGASTPNVVIEKVIKKLKKIKHSTVTEISGIKENIIFHMPKELKKIKNITNL
ncbi:MAG: 4-hydroxy-3-methylbut-2-enyl diphosphate reductase [Buchnera aphidicola (Meitanaphis flavogallis)]